MSVRGCILFALLVTAAHAQTLPQAEALWKAHRFTDANNAFRTLVAQHPDNLDYKVRWGRLLLEDDYKAGNKADAATLFQEVLEKKKDHAGALLGLALVAADGFEDKAVELARKALAADPHSLEAQELLARLALEDNNEKKAIEEAGKALAMSPHALDAMAVRATIDWLNDKPDTPWIGKILADDPHNGRAYETAGHFFVLNRRYEEGINFYRKALELEPDLWRARSQLGVNLMRLGQDGEARQQLVQCYENGFRDDATVNSLTLLDSYKNFVFYRTPTTILKLHKKEAEVLRPYFEAELERALSTYEKKYQFKLQHPVQIEVYPDHEDFAVRTLGMPGLGALGVTFGYIVAMDSPTGRKPGSFHWASTMWHELSHVYVLAATNHHVPRWFTEGMAVYEETAVSPEWGDRLDISCIRAIKDKKLLPVAELDRGFVRPSYPSQVIVSYFQAGRICGYIAKNWGYATLLAMMHDFASSTTTADVIRKELKLEPQEFDKRFLAALDAETGKTVAGFDEWFKRIKGTVEAARAKKYDDVIREGTAIRDIYPDYVEAGSVYELLAEAYIAKQNKPAAIAELTRYAKQGGREPAVLKQLATLLEEAGRRQEAAQALDRLNYVEPQDEDLHQRLGSLWLELGNISGAIREYQAVVARKPMDPAASHYNLARALRSANRTEEAKEQLLLSLEAAPGYRPAQKMLLELSQ